MEKLHNVLQIIIVENYIYVVICSVIYNMGLDKFIHSIFYLLVVHFYAQETVVVLPVSIHNMLALFGEIDTCFV